ncbi:MULTISPECIES: hypothetical protein [unclassified Vibrio]|uniref:hypothetical protein n=1 Tax=unclassified Vibrio TaxID=2614977 RepID=UPI00148234E5|nr:MULTISPECIES: hypothetical protein [unclassified Vibrio]
MSRYKTRSSYHASRLLALNKPPSFPTARNERDRESLPCRKKIPDISSLDSGMTIQ